MTSAPKPIYGIDLGTTYSCVARVDEHDRPVVIPNSEGQLTTPSVVYFESPDSQVVGESARQAAKLFPDRVVSTVKRVMGDEIWEIEQHGVVYKPQEVSAIILDRLVKDAGKQMNEEITDVVITCPAYFGLTRREATKQAGELAGLNVHHVIPEPTAAAFAYGFEYVDGPDQTIFVFDLGGGTFDVTVLRVGEGEIKVVCTGGDHALGGKDWDEAIAQWFANAFADETGENPDDLLSDPEAWQELLQKAEQAKVALSTRKSFPHRVQYRGSSAVVELTRDKFEEITEGKLELALSLTDELCWTAMEKGLISIDKVILVGGSTYMPQVERAVRERFPEAFRADGFEVLRFDPNQAVAKGAALMARKCQVDRAFNEWVRQAVARKEGKDAAEVTEQELTDAKRDRDLRLAGEQEVAEELGMSQRQLAGVVDLTIRNATAKSLGLQIWIPPDYDESHVWNFIKIHDEVPKTVTHKVVTVHDNQNRMSLSVRESEEADEYAELEMCEEIGRTHVAFERPLPRKSPVEVTFSLRDDGIIHVHAIDLTTGGEVSAEFKSDALLTKDEVAARRTRHEGENAG